MPLKFRDRPVRDLPALLERLEEDERNLPGRRRPVIWFRGQARAADGLVPSFHQRNMAIADEIYMMNLFKQSAHELIQGQAPFSEWEWMFLMRHHGLPSRLLDWTENPLVGLYFAARTPEGTRANGALWCLLPSQLNKWSLAWPDDNFALPMFTENQSEFPLGENEALLSYLPSRLRRPRPRVPPPLPAAAMAVRTSKRIQAQLGVFTIHHLDKVPLERAGDRSHIWRFIIPAAQKARIQAQLRRIGVTRRALFPELDNVALVARDIVEAI